SPQLRAFYISQTTGFLRSDFPVSLPGSAEEAVLEVQNLHHLVNESVDLVNPQSQFLYVSGRPQVQDGKVLSPEAEKMDHSVLHQPEPPCCDLPAPWHCGLNVPMLLAGLLMPCP